MIYLLILFVLQVIATAYFFIQTYRDMKRQEKQANDSLQAIFDKIEKEENKPISEPPPEEDVANSARTNGVE